MDRKTILAILIALATAGPVAAQHPFHGPDEGSGVQTRRGNASPPGGFSAGEANSRIDDYFNQDEQINITPDSGVVKVLRVNQKNLINDFVTAVFPLRNVHPREIRNVMRVVCGKEGGRAEVIRDKIKKDYFLQVICPKFQLPWIEQAVAALDVDWLKQARDGSLTVRYYSKYRPAETLVQFADFYAGEGSTASDPVGNFITRRDEPYRVEKWLKACETFDVPPPQALLKFEIWEIDTTNDLQLGVDWIAWKNGPGRSLFEAILGGQKSHHSFDNASGFFDPNLGAFTIVSPGHSTFTARSTQTLLSANYLLTSAFLDFLRVKGKARVLASPELFVFSHTPATWKATDQVLGFEVTPSDPGPLGLVPTRVNSFDLSGDITPNDAFDTPPDVAVHNRFLNHRVRTELGLELNVFAAIALEAAEVEIELVASDLAGETPQGTPILTNRRIVTKVRLADGQPFVFGGLTREQDVDASNKAPWLGDIPVLGYLFGQETKTRRRKELVVSVTPRFFQGAPKDVVEPVMLDTRALASGEKPIEMPDNSFGFDQWLFDTVEHP